MDQQEGQGCDGEGELGLRARIGVWWKDFKIKVWNEETKEFLGRTPRSWGAILLYNFSFFLVTMGFLAICFSVFLQTIHPLAPNMQNYYASLKFNPGMNYEPQASRYSILINCTDSHSRQINLEQLKMVIGSEYCFEYITNASRNKNNSYCSEYEMVKNQGVACSFNTSTLGNVCSSSNDYGYLDNKPCVLLRVNKIYGWDPSASDLTNLSCTGKTRSPGCDKFLEFQEVPQSMKTSLVPGYMPVSCHGQSAADDKNILGVSFFPSYGFPFFHFPYFNQPGFQSPIVMAQFHLVPNKTVMVWCKFWTSEVKHNLLDRQGSVAFEIMIRRSNSTDLEMSLLKNVTSNIS